jgi:hypothetical protein
VVVSLYVTAGMLVRCVLGTRHWCVTDGNVHGWVREFNESPSTCRWTVEVTVYITVAYFLADTNTLQNAMDSWRQEATQRYSSSLGPPPLLHLQCSSRPSDLTPPSTHNIISMTGVHRRDNHTVKREWCQSHVSGSPVTPT